MRWVIGFHSVREALRVRPHAVRRLQIVDRWKSNEDLRSLALLAESAGVKLQVSPEGVLNKIAQGHQGVVAEMTQNPMWPTKKIDAGGQCLLLALDGIEDPQNFGAMIRTSWLLGVSGIVVPKNRQAPVSPVVAKVASGGCEHVPVEVVSNLGSYLTHLKEKGFWIFGLSEKGSRDLWNVELPERVIWVVGNEGVGLKTPIRKVCDELVSIPQTQNDASLNASISVAIALAETARQRSL